MKISQIGISLSLLLMCLTVPTNSSYSQTSEAITNDVIEIDGSSTVFPITEAVQKEFTESNPNLSVSAAFSGTGGGFEKFCAGQTDINGASRPISLAELEACRNAGVRFIELPIAFDAITVAVHPSNDDVSDITTEELKKIWSSSAQGQINNWQDVNSNWSDKPLNLYGPGSDSGTYDYFAEVITGESNTRSDYVSSEDDEILVEKISQDPNALGYFGLSYYLRNPDKLKALAVNGVSPSVETVKDATYQPLSRPLFIYVNVQSAQNNPELRQFVDFYLNNAPRIVEEVGYVPLPEEAYRVGLVHFYNGKVGTAYQGVPEPNLTIREVLLREQQF